MRNKRTLIALAGALASSSILVAATGAVSGAGAEAEVTTVDVPPPLYPYFYAAVGDVTGDGLDDVVHSVLVDLDWSKLTVAVFAGRSDGGLEAGVATEFPPNTETSAMTVGDMNGDGLADLVQFERSCASQFCDDDRPPPDWDLTVRLGNENGTFGSPQVVFTPGLPTSQIELGDFDGDGDLDIAGTTIVGEESPSGWWENDGGAFGPFQSFGASCCLSGVGQFGGGSAADVLLEGQDSWAVVLDPGTSGSSVNVAPEGSDTYARSIADVDGDGLDDVLYVRYDNFPSNSQWMLRLSNGDGTFGSPMAIRPYASDSDAVLADVDGTGRHDIVFFDTNDDVTVIDPEGVVAPYSAGQIDLANEAVVGNFDGAGTDDVVRFSYGNSVVPDAFKIFRFPQTDPDADGDGILDEVDIDDGTGASPGAFGDANVDGTIVSVPDGWSVLVSDAPDPDDGVRIVVEGVEGAEPTERVELSVCGSTLQLSAGSDVLLTCGSVVIEVLSGTVEVELGGGLAVVVIRAGSAAEVDSLDDGSYMVNVLQGSVTVSVDGVDRMLDAGEDATIRTWSFIGFDQPVDGGAMVNSVKAGRAVPLKWRLLDETGAPVLDLQSVELTFLRTSCDTSAVDPVEDTVSVGSGLQNKGDGNYQLNWKTPSAKRCGTLQLDVGDGVLHTAKFRLT